MCKAGNVGRGQWKSWEKRINGSARVLHLKNCSPAQTLPDRGNPRVPEPLLFTTIDKFADTVGSGSDVFKSSESQ